MPKDDPKHERPPLEIHDFQDGVPVGQDLDDDEEDLGDEDDFDDEDDDEPAQRPAADDRRKREGDRRTDRRGEGTSKPLDPAGLRALFADANAGLLGAPAASTDKAGGNPADPFSSLTDEQLSQLAQAKGAEGQPILDYLEGRRRNALVKALGQEVMDSIRAGMQSDAWDARAAQDFGDRLSDAQNPLTQKAKAAYATLSQAGVKGPALNFLAAVVAEHELRRESNEARNRDRRKANSSRMPSSSRRQADNDDADLDLTPEMMERARAMHITSKAGLRAMVNERRVGRREARAYRGR